MRSRKQQILCQLLYHGLLSLRMICGLGAWSGWWWRLRNPGIYQVGFEEANFLHRVHFSILEPEFVDNDISFVNLAFPVHIERLGRKLPAETARLMVEFYDLVPEPLRPQLSWHPNPELRRLAEKTNHGWHG